MERILIKRLNEQDEIVSNSDVEEFGINPQSVELPVFNQEQSLELPQEGQSSADNTNMLILTLGDFIEKCKQINPLVSMGILSFIEANKDAFNGQTNQTEQPDDLNFPGQTNQVEQPGVNITQDEFQFPR